MKDNLFFLNLPSVIFQFSKCVMAVDNNHLIGLSILKAGKAFDLTDYVMFERLRLYPRLLPN